MQTYFVCTESAKGKRGGRGLIEKWIVLAPHREGAIQVALANAHDGAIAVNCELVTGVYRVSCA